MKRQYDAVSPLGGTSVPITTEFPSTRRERVDWHKLASVDLHELKSTGCDIEMLQENLSHVTFCDAESEFDMATSSGQRSLLKMFRMAQLLLQYMFISQEYMETQLHNAQTQIEESTQKCTEVSIYFYI